MSEEWPLTLNSTLSLYTNPWSWQLPHVSLTLVQNCTTGSTSPLAFAFHLCTVSFLVDSFSPQCPPLPPRRFLPHPPPHCCPSNWLTQPHHNSCRVGVLQNFPRGSPQIINISTWASDCHVTAPRGEEDKWRLAVETLLSLFYEKEKGNLPTELWNCRT